MQALGCLDALEPRVLLAAAPVISEFMASNSSGLRDSDGDASDWIELHNPSSAPLNLDGYYLTDTAGDPDRWQLPAVTLPAGAYLVVFASGKDRAVAGQQLHTDFELDADGGYLALLAPDGVTPVSEYAPYPEQLANVSYGRSTTTTQRALLTTGATARYHVPKPADASLGTGWTRPDFDDSAWSTGPTSLGFDTDASGITYTAEIRTDLSGLMSGLNASLYARLAFGVADADAYDSIRLRNKYDDGFVAYLNGAEIARRNAPASVRWDSTALGDRSEGEVLAGEDIVLDLPEGLLAEGQNILALHGLNDSAASSDFLLGPQLIGLDVGAVAERYYTTATPGAANANSDLTGRVDDTTFSHDRGFHDAPFNLVIESDTPGATIRYTLDGTPPTATSGLIYSGPVRIAGTTVLRAAAFKPGMLPSDVDTQTYLFLDDVIRQSANGQPSAGWPASWSPNTTDYGMDPDVVNHPLYSSTIKNDLKTIPSMSLVMPLSDLFGSSGIYSNPGNAGRLWEKASSLELIHPDGTDGFQVNAGVRLRGGFSRSTANPKHAFRFIFRGQYGDAKLDYPLFGEDQPDSIEGFDLRTFQNYSWSFGGDSAAVFIRDQFSRDAAAAMGLPGHRGKYYHLYINGQYWGLFNTEQRPEADFAAEQFGGTDEDYDVIKVDPQRGHAIHATDGDMAAWTDLWNQSMALKAAADSGATADTLRAAYMKMRGLNPDGTRNPAYSVLLDADNLIDYMLVIFYGGNLDAPLSAFIGNAQPNNFYAIRRRGGEEGFKFFVHDAEHTLLNVNEDRTGPYNTINPNPAFSLGYSNPQFIFQLLSSSPEFRLRVADRVHKHFFNDGMLAPARARELFMARVAEIDRAVVGESARWGDAKRATPLTRADWLAEVNRLTVNDPGTPTPNDSYFSRRTGIVLNQLINDGLYPNPSTVRTPEYSMQGGVIQPATQITISNPLGVGTIYYTTDGSDPRLPGGALSPTARAYAGPISSTFSFTLEARIRLSNGTWSALNEKSFTLPNTTLKISEVMYHPADAPPDSPYSADDFEFIELINTGSSPMNLTGVQFTQGITFRFPAGFMLAAGARTLVIRNAAAFESRYGSGKPIAGVFEDGSLSDGGETLTLADAAAVPILTFDYRDTWHPITDGGGYSLVVMNPAASTSAILSTPAPWRPSNLAGGAPGAADPGLAPGSVVISEALANSTSTLGDWVELHNTTASPIDLSGWFLSDSAVDLRKFRIANNTIIPGGGYLLLTSLNDFHFDFASDRAEIYLSNHDDAGNPAGYRDYADFAASEPDVAFGRYVKPDGTSDFTSLGRPTPLAVNAPPLIGPVIINEVMYNPAAGRHEYIELRNLTSSAVSLAGWSFVTGVDIVFPKTAAISAFGLALVVPIAPDVFRSTYSIPASVPIFGPFSGNLSNDTADLKLSRPLYPGSPGSPFMLIDKLKYDDASPWPVEADGTGVALTRLSPLTYGNQPSNWTASAINGTPGAANAAVNQPVIDAGLATATLAQGATFTRSGSFSDPDANTWTATVNYGDGSATQPLSLIGGKTFTLSRAYPAPGTYVITVTVTDNTGRSASDTILLAVTPGPRAGTTGNDTFTLRLDPGGTTVQFWENRAVTSAPNFTLPRQALGQLMLSGNSGDDVMVIDTANGSPLLPDIDLGRARLVLHAADLGARDEYYSTLSQMLLAGRVGPGLRASPATPLTGLGLFSDAATLTVRRVYNGDADGSGRIDISDYFAIDRGRAAGNSGYASGDFNFSGQPGDADDYMLIDRAFLGQGSTLSVPSFPHSPTSPLMEEDEDEDPDTNLLLA